MITFVAVFLTDAFIQVVAVNCLFLLWSFLYYLEKTGYDSSLSILHLLLPFVISLLSMVVALLVQNMFGHLFINELNQHLLGSEAEMLLDSYPSHTALFDVDQVHSKEEPKYEIR